MISKNLTKDLIGGVFLLTTGLLYFALSYDAGVAHLTQDVEVEAVDAFLKESVEQTAPVIKVLKIHGAENDGEPDCI